jgi:YYY domain-containing protein
MLDFIAWYFMITLVGVLALPVALRFLPNLADRGYILARALGLLLWGFIFWLLASLHILQNDLGGVILALIILALVSTWLGRGWRGWREVFAFLRSRVRLVAVTEVLFLAAFAFLALTRAASPYISGTEKPMEMAFINSILRSPTFPPADPWLSGYAISYYYFGYVMVAMLIRLSGVTTGVGFNLAISLWFAMTALGAFSVSFTLLTAWCKRRQAEGKPGFLAAGWALLAPFFILIVSNVEGFLEMLHADGIFWQQTATGLQSSFWQWLDLPELVNPPASPFTLIPIHRAGIWWWRASRVVVDYNLQHVYQEVIDEFPFFSYYLADLHPHVLSMPFVLLAIGMALNLYLWGTHLHFSELSLRVWPRKVEFWLAAIVLGGLSFLNTWDFPIYLALFSAAFTLVRVQQDGWRWKDRLRDFFGLAIALGIVGIVLYLPFYVGFQSQAGGILPSLSFFTRGVYFWIMFAPFLVPIFAYTFWLWRRRQGSVSTLWNGLRFALGVLIALGVFSWFLGWLGVSLPGLGDSLSTSSSPVVARLGAFLSYAGGLFTEKQGSSDPYTLLVSTLLSRLQSPGTWLTLGILITLVWGLLSTYRRRVEMSAVAAVAMGPELVVPDLEPDPPSADPLPDLPSDHLPQIGEPDSVDPPSPGPAASQSPVGEQPIAYSSGSPNAFLLLLILVGAGLTITPEFIYLRDQFGTRMNTIFKFYFETWIIWGTAAATVSAILWKELRKSSQVVFGLGFFLVLAMALPYPYFALSDRLDVSNAKNWTLDGEANFASYYPDDWAAIKWLQKAPYGVVVEAVGGDYSDYARVATHTGLPDVLGWIGHELQWRGGAAEMGSRQSDIARLYETNSWQEALSIIQQYNIQYIFVGGFERSKYRVNELKFKNNLVAVFQSNQTVIYEVPVQLLSAKGTG